MYLCAGARFLTSDLNAPEVSTVIFPLQTSVGVPSLDASWSIRNVRCGVGSGLADIEILRQFERSRYPRTQLRDGVRHSTTTSCETFAELGSNAVRSAFAPFAAREYGRRLMVPSNRGRGDLASPNLLDVWRDQSAARARVADVSASVFD